MGNGTYVSVSDVPQFSNLRMIRLDMYSLMAEGCIDLSVFDTRYGLCDNLYNWARKEDLQAELRYQFRAEFGSAYYPFNNRDPQLYKEEKNKYTNQDRLDWIAEHTPSED